MRRAVAWTLLALWGAAVVASILLPTPTPPSGTVFMRGLKRVEAFMGWQPGAAALVCIAGRGLRRGSPARRLLRLPAGLAALLVATALCLLIWARFGARPVAPPLPPSLG